MKMLITGNVTAVTQGPPNSPFFELGLQPPNNRCRHVEPNSPTCIV